MLVLLLLLQGCIVSYTVRKSPLLLLLLLFSAADCLCGWLLLDLLRCLCYVTFILPSIFESCHSWAHSHQNRSRALETSVQRQLAVRTDHLSVFHLVATTQITAVLVPPPQSCAGVLGTNSACYLAVNHLLSLVPHPPPLCTAPEHNMQQQLQLQQRTTSALLAQGSR